MDNESKYIGAPTLPEFRDLVDALCRQLGDSAANWRVFTCGCDMVLNFDYQNQHLIVDEEALFCDDFDDDDFDDDDFE